MNDWRIFTASGTPHAGIKTLEAAPSWRRFDDLPEKGKLTEDKALETRFKKHKFEATAHEIEVVNAALYLRRPLLVTGKPGTGKTTLAYAIAHELQLDKVLTWSITSRSLLKDAIYQYDAIGRLQEANLRQQENPHEKVSPPNTPPNIGEFIRLGPLGTALLPRRYPRVLLIDEIDKSDIDLPNDLLHIFEEGRFEIPELTRLTQAHKRTQLAAQTAETEGEGKNETQASEQTLKPNIVEVFQHDSDTLVPIENGRVRCAAFPIVVMTSNGEREFPPPFLRRCIRLNIPPHSKEKLTQIIDSYFKEVEHPDSKERAKLVDLFLQRRETGDLSTDQLLNAIHLTQHHFPLMGEGEQKDALIETILQHLSRTG